MLPNPDKVGPAGLLRACRSLIDDLDHASGARPDSPEEPYRLLHCRSILKCVQVRPKGLLPAVAIIRIRT
jgi:succinate dehydrogenase/fumarate reductase-like Fe-S protein